MSDSSLQPPIPLALTGATGFVGTALVRQLCAAAPGTFSARALVRGAVTRLLSENATAVVGDVTAAPKAFFPAEPFVLVHFATKQIDTDGTGFEATNVHGTARLLDALPSRCLGVIYGSSMSVYGQGCQRAIDESTPLSPTTPLAVSRYEAEALILKYGTDHGCSVVPLRPRFVLGVGDRYTLPGLQRLFARGLTIGDERQRFSVIDVDDYGRLILCLAQRIAQRATRGEALVAPFNVGYRRPVSLGELRLALASKQPRLRIPFGQKLQVIASKVPGLRTAGLLTKLELMGLDHYADVSRLVDEVGDEITGRDPLFVLAQAAFLLG